MIVNIYDVGHGFCGYVRDEITGDNLLIDCGYNAWTGFHPVDEILADYGPLGGLVVQNFDEDHIDGLPHLFRVAGPTPVGAFIRNPSLTPEQLVSLKEPPYGAGLRALLRLMLTYTAPIAPRVVSPWAEVHASCYYNPFPLFNDTNNLSVVTFIHGPGYSVIFTGDLEVAGWRMLLLNRAFRQELARVKVFVASHHGRENGYCKEVFAYCRPEVIVISDGAMQFETQANCYAQHAMGIPWWNGTRIETRRVLTTRHDGHLRIAPGLGFHGLITATAA